MGGCWCLLFVSILAAPALAQPPAAGAPTAPPPRSPEVAADRRVTFRLRAPNAAEVLLARDGSPRVPMQKDAQGGYSFIVDGTPCSIRSTG